MGTLTDEEIVRAIVRGDVDQFRILVERTKNEVMAVVSRRIPPQDAAEVCHDAFVRAFRSLDSYRAESPFSHWVKKIAVRECYDYWRDRYHRPEPIPCQLSTEESGFIESLLVTGSIEAFDSSERQRIAADLLARALDGLSPENRAVVTLVHLEGRTVREAAETLGWSLVNVKVRAHRARGHLRKILESLIDAGRS
ncbi:MAG: RNA polymerase sigma factor [Bdellovibrionota bacterium]